MFPLLVGVRGFRVLRMRAFVFEDDQTECSSISSTGFLWRETVISPRAVPRILLRGSSVDACCISSTGLEGLGLPVPSSQHSEQAILLGAVRQRSQFPDLLDAEIEERSVGTQGLMGGLSFLQRYSNAVFVAEPGDCQCSFKCLHLVDGGSEITLWYPDNGGAWISTSTV